VTLTDREEKTLKHLTQMIARGVHVDDAVAELRVMLNDNALIDRVLDARAAILEQRRSVLFQKAVFDPEDEGGSWYMGPQLGDKYWPSLKSALESDPSWVEAVPSIDSASESIVGMLGNPMADQIKTRGLVVGYVQSGKTANFTATIAKAADAGYRMFIVLSGVHNSLRRQTQLRLDEQLTDLNPIDWMPLTDEFHDFGNPVRALPLVAGELKLIAVVKKNVSRLAKLRTWLEQAYNQGGLERCPVLIIDDEADQASPNAHRDPELDRTRVNQEIVGLLALPRVAYIGYTATPFANVLANPRDKTDIYPRSFIYALPKPEGYFGAEELFGLEDESPEAPVAHDMIRIVEPDEEAVFRPGKGEPFEAQVPKSLGDAIRWFVLATAARRCRTGAQKHSSMLIHTSTRVAHHLEMLPVVREYVSALRTGWASGRRSEWEEQWAAEQNSEPPSLFGHEVMPFADLVETIGAVLAEVRIVADNSQSSERLLYADDPATVIAVGGNTLSRGLTLYGLVSSYFLRAGGSYDSVLQMGRWFGYRPGYEDLPRVWTTQDLANDFRFLSVVEREIRIEIERYRGGISTPRDLAVRILLHPRMSVTAKNKMYFAIRATSSFSEHRPQTTYFNHRDAAVIASNLDATRTLLTALVGETSMETVASYELFRAVGVDRVLRFLEHYSFHESSDMANDLVANYVREQNSFGALLHWNVAINSLQGGQKLVDIGVPVSPISRSRLRASSDSRTANIGTLMSRQDRLVDLESGLTVKDDDHTIQLARNSSGTPLLVLYPIDANSVPRLGVKGREPLDALDTVIGVAIVFPRSAPGSDDGSRIQVELDSGDSTAEDDEEAPYEDSEGSRDDVSLDE
jgi:hypothetical protein